MTGIGRIRQFLPGALYGPPLRWTTPRLAGRSDRRHIALTLDDGPDPGSTPALLATLRRHDVRATFFLVGEHIGANRGLVSEMHEEGHELAVHGWSHRCTLLLSPARLRRDIATTVGAITEITGIAPRWYRPPYGVTTMASRDAAGGSGLAPVLWTAWGRDWSRHVDARGVVDRVERTLRPGGTVLLHDTDRYSAPGSWLRTDQALSELLTRWGDAAVPVGPLRDHWASAD